MAQPRRRAGRAAGASAAPVAFRQPRNPFPPLDILTPEQLERIERASFEILENIGIEFLLDEALDILAAAGAEVDRATQRVRFDRAMILEKIRTAPPQFTMHARNPAHNTIIGGDHVVYTAVSGPGCALDLKRGRRNGTYRDLVELIKLAQSFPIIHNIGGFICDNTDMHELTRHLYLYQAQQVYADKCIQPSARGFNHAHDAVEIAAIVHGGREHIRQFPVTMTVINSNSPLRFDDPMLEGMIEYVRAGQCVIITPFTLAGAMAPITLAGALAQQNAEALAGIALAQIINPGGPVMYGGFTSNTDMQSGSPAFGTPEGAWAILAGGQLARRYNLPYRSSGVANSKAPDAQAAWESMMSLWPVTLAKANYVLHAAGWVDAGVTTSYEKFIIDCELLQMMDTFMSGGIQVDDSTLAMDAITEVGPGGHFFGHPHTMERYRTEFYRPMIADWQNWGAWAERGSQTAEQRAFEKWNEVLRDYQQPPLDPAIAEELEAYVKRREKAILPNGA
jgi:trimethylamine--corrinoid protein Co-methyltransferase